MDTSIAMSGAQPNFLAIKAGANQMAQQQIQNNQQNALAGYVQQNGAAIMNGDPNALAGYAAYDPGAALGIQNTRQSMAYDAEEMAMKRTAIAQQTAETLAANKTAADIAAMEAEQDKLQGVLTGAFQFYQSGDEAGYNAFLQQNQLDPSQYAFSNFPAIAAQADGVIDGIKAWKDSFGPDGGNGVNVTVNNGGEVAPMIGTIPQGYAAVPDPSSPSGYKMYPIGGGPEDNSAQIAAQASSDTIAGETILTAASRAREAAGGRVVGGWIGEGVAKVNPASSNAEVYRQVDVLKSNAKVENLTAMRQASPTGGALGSVTEKEAQMLAEKSGALDPKSPNFLRDLDDYELTLLRVIHGEEAGRRIYDSTRSGNTPAPQPAPGSVLTYNPETGDFE